MRFSRDHRYGVGQDLRRDAMSISRAVDRAWFARKERAAQIVELDKAIDDFKLTLQLAKDLEAFQGWRQFDAIWRQISEIGKQCGGWLRQQQHPEGQNPAAPPQGRRERATRLSAPAASQNEAKS